MEYGMLSSALFSIQTHEAIEFQVSSSKKRTSCK